MPVRNRPCTEKLIDKGFKAIKSYYQEQQVCQSDDELDRMIDVMQKELPAAFRITASCNFANLIIERYKTFKFGDETPQKLPWMPMGFTMESLGRRDIRRNELLAELKKDILGDAERGAVVRQEVVSMVPPVFLEMTKQCACLDTCAAPGSKTSQLLDYVSRDSLKNTDPLMPEFPREAAVIGNDANITRARVLSHQMQKQGNPASGVVCSDATNFPKALNPEDLFDRVLCDVPCSGDGTARKNIDVVCKWSARGGLQVHTRQLQILQRGLELVAPGGLLVYSTCSMNPIEDEAVVGAALSAKIEQFDLVDMHHNHPEKLCAAPSLMTWKVPDPDEEGRYHASFQSLETKKKYLVSSMFSDQIIEAARCQLPRTSRFLPHMNNTGGFYVAVFRSKETAQPNIKKQRRNPSSYQERVSFTDDTVIIAELPKREEVEQKGEEVERMGEEVERKGEEVEQKGEEVEQKGEEVERKGEFPTASRLSMDDDIASIIDFYGLSDRAMRKTRTPFDEGRFVEDSECRNGDVGDIDIRDAVRDFSIEFENDDAFPLYKKKEGSGDRRIYLATPRLLRLYKSHASLNFISVGCKAFEKLDTKFAVASGCPYRLMNDSIMWLIPYMRRRIVFCTIPIIELALKEALTKNALLDNEHLGNIKNLNSCRIPATGNVNPQLQPGGLVLVAQDEDTFGIVRIPALLSLHGNISCFIPKISREQHLAYIARLSTDQDA